jgi:xanthine dehydrogenase accessory factor
MKLNEFVHEKNIVSSYDVLSPLVGSGDHHYVVIMTFGYRTDAIALRALIGKDYRYIGMLGSRKKIEKLFADLASEGITAEALRNIHAPAGINIKSETPEEIAVSIAAEIIKAKNLDGEFKC